MKRYRKLTKLRFKKLSAIAIVSCYFCLAIATVNNPAIAKSPDWVVRSDHFAELLSKAIEAQDCQEKFAVSDRLLEINPAFRACRQQNMQKALQTLKQKLASENNTALHLDLEILLEAGQRSLKAYKLDEKYQLSYIHFFVEQEVKRYTKTMQGLAPTYFYGSQQLWQLRSQLEQTLGKEFTLQKFHDFVLSQAFLMPKVMQDPSLIEQFKSL
ncbi:MAG: hypothetical protein RLZZ574_3394 [Cyanobacteriota bacterium]|jgi:hypothetical protein